MNKNECRLSSLSDKLITNRQIEPLKPGDQVRIRSEEEITATLDSQRKLKGCNFVEAMKPYCGTIQRVLKPMERFVDEQDQRVKLCKGLVLLEGVMCDGFTMAGRCDKCCFLFWREEWLAREVAQ